MSPIMRHAWNIRQSDRRLSEGSRLRRRIRVGLELLEGRITPTSVTGVNPPSGPIAGGTLVTISGTGFAGVTAVDFGTTPAMSESVVSPTSIMAESPAGGIGPVHVTVTAAGGVSTPSAADLFTYAPVPVVSELSQANGPAAGGTSVTITGTGFTGSTAVYFGSVPATDLTVVNDASITVDSPAGTGTVDVTVRAVGGTSAASPADEFTYGPTISSINPMAGGPGGGTTVTITGTGFVTGSVVDFGTTPATNVTVNPNSTSITASSPPGANSVYVTVMTPRGTSADVPSSIFTYVAAPVVSGLSPATGSVGGGTLVTITGTGFLGATAVNFGTGTQSAAFYFTVVSNTTIVAASPTSVSTANPLGGGTVNVNVTTPGGNSQATSPPAPFTYGPAVTGISPAVGPLSGGTLVAITGIGFTGATAVDFGTNAATIVSVNANTIMAMSPPDSAGGVNVTVTTTPGVSSAASPVDVFTYVAAPLITGISPGSGPFAGGSAVTITGDNLAGATGVKFGAGAFGSIVGDSADQIVVNSPMAVSAGAVGVTVITPGGVSAPVPFTYESAIAPVISSVAPNFGPLGGGTMVTITGTGFNPAATAMVLFGTTPATGVSVDSSTMIMAVSPAGTGAVAVTVITEGAMSSPTAGDVFTYIDGPQVTSVLRYGYHRQATSLVVGFNGPLDASSAQDAANYRIVGPGKQRIKVKAAVYDPEGDSVTLMLGRRLLLHRSYMLTIVGMPPSGVNNPAGLFLDGMGGGQAGSNYVVWLTGRNLAGAASELPNSKTPNDRESQTLPSPL